jgi:hypothetical protein
MPAHQRRHLPIGIRLHRHPERLKPANVVIEQWNVLEFIRIEWDFQPSGVKLAGIEPAWILIGSDFKPAGVVIVRGRFVFRVIPRRLLIERSGIVADIEIVNGNKLPSRNGPKRSDAQSDQSEIRRLDGIFHVEVQLRGRLEEEAFRHRAACIADRIRHLRQNGRDGDDRGQRLLRRKLGGEHPCRRRCPSNDEIHGERHRGRNEREAFETMKAAVLADSSKPVIKWAIA